MEMRPAAMDGRMISSGEADPRSLLTLMTVMGNKLDHGHAQSEEHAHGIAGTGRMTVFSIEPLHGFEGKYGGAVSGSEDVCHKAHDHHGQRLAGFFLWEREK